MKEIVFLADGTFLDLRNAKVIPLKVVVDLRTTHSDYRYALLRCGGCRLEVRNGKQSMRLAPMQIRIHTASKIRRLMCPICKRPTAYASQFSRTPIEDERSALINNIP